MTDKEPVLTRTDSHSSQITTSTGVQVQHELHGQIAAINDHDPNEPYIDITVHLTPKEQKRRSKWWYKTAAFLWDSADKHPNERSFLFKLDFFLMSSAMLGYFIKTLNQTNIRTAYVNGMKEHYNMSGNHYNLLNTLWTVGYIIGQVPSNLILHRISARYYLAGLEITWAILTVLMILPTNMAGLYAIRFLIGLTEAGYFPGLEYLLGSWYSSAELNKRSTLFACAGTAAGLISGPLQESVLHATFTQGSKWAPFQWMFIFDAVISAPVGFYTLFADPNTPSTTSAWFFSERDVLVALERRRRIGAQLNTRESYTWPKIKSFFNTWHIWVFPWLFFCFRLVNVASSSQGFQLWMKTDLKLSSYQYNIYPTGIDGGGIGYAIVAAYINDYHKNRLTVYFLLFMFISGVVSYGGLSYWNINTGFKWFCFFFYSIANSPGQSMIFSWVNKNLAYDDMKRNFLVVITNVVSYIFTAWISLVVFNQDDAPEFQKGYIFVTCISGLGLILTALSWVLLKRDDVRYLKEHGHARDIHDGNAEIILDDESTNADDSQEFEEKTKRK
ncbi:putative transporter SEO1 [Wickerhamomyces ciferrii]|uniref:Transporter SEO1 n=1 Tax=Wickerhamomyces ciferrii (strain ATCC 14091 / BCRC 22168 / CBS 111 / JCM 3599 / NBRC 0793 / NRRL Y-1031 F-60-10) TaxID=1206466 RepID=K0KMA4_WICCF|nr:putative transporter SEO1 [Wickerhamomyces ciferrii]CCH42243.1 putative transporter SEO1 [Wickerhamomyces ciferrii]